MTSEGNFPYIVSVIDNWDHHEGSGIDEPSCATAEEATAAAREVIDRSLARLWWGDAYALARKTGEDLYERWCRDGDNVYVFATDGAPPIEPRFQPYEYAERRAAEIAGHGGVNADGGTPDEKPTNEDDSDGGKKIGSRRGRARC